MITRQYVGEFEVDRVHFVDDSAEVCTEPKCEEHHMWSVYIRNPEGMAEWLSDHLTDDLALAAANAYGPVFDQTGRPNTEEKR